MTNQQFASFNTAAAWHTGIAVAVREGLTFEAREPESDGKPYIIIYTGGY